MGERLKKLIGKHRELEMTQIEVSKAIGIDRATLNRICNDKQSIGFEAFKQFCEKFNVNPQWLLWGTGEKFIDKEATEPYSRHDPLERIMLFALQSFNNVYEQEDIVVEVYLRFLTSIERSSLYVLKGTEEEVKKARDRYNVLIRERSELFRLMRSSSQGFLLSFLEIYFQDDYHSALTSGYFPGGAPKTIPASVKTIVKKYREIADEIRSIIWPDRR